MPKIKTLLFLLFLVRVHLGFSQEIRELALGKPAAVVDLRTIEGSQLVKMQWQTLNAQITPYEI